MQNEILNLIINGSSNKINATHRKCFLSNIDGSNNKIYIKRHNRNVYLNNNSFNNSENENIVNFDGSNISINVNGNNEQISKIIKIYKVVI